MRPETQPKNGMNAVHIAAIAAGSLLVTVALALLLRENGSYSTEALVVIGGLGVAVIGLLILTVDALGGST